MSAATIRRMGVDPESHLLAIVEAAEGALSRAQIYSRVSDDFVDEEDLARCLGRMVADGRLHRSFRQRPGAKDEFVYGTSAPALIETIASQATTPQPAASKKEKPSMSKPKRRQIGATRARVVEFVVAGRGWLSPATIASELGLTSATVTYHLSALLRDGAVQATGRNQARRYAANGVAPQAPEPAPVPAPEELVVPEAAPKRRKAKRRARAAEAAPARNLAEFGAPPRVQLPAIAKQVTDEPSCAIEDTGAFALNDGHATIRLTPKGIGKVVRFLELTQHVWKGEA